MSEVRVLTGPVTVAVTLSGAPFFTDRACTTAASFPATISADTSFYAAPGTTGECHLTVTLSGVTLFDRDVWVHPDSPVVIDAEPLVTPGVVAKATQSGTSSALPALRRANVPGVEGIPSTVMTSPPTITTVVGGGPNAGIAVPTPVVLSASPQRFTVRGGHMSLVIDSSYSRPDNVTPVDSSEFLPVWVEWMTDAPIFEIDARQVGGKYRLLVDDQLISATTAVLPTGGAGARISVDFAGVRKMRKVTMECDGVPISQVIIGATDTLCATPLRGPRGLVIGDSYIEGTGCIPDGTNTVRFLDLGTQLCQMLGLADSYVSGSGGTGYLKTNGSKVKYRDRWWHDGGQYTPDVVIVTGGRNDNGTFTTSQVGAEAALLFADVQSKLPRTQLVVIGPWGMSNADNAGLAPYRDAIHAVVPPSAIWVDPLGIVTGTGNIGGVKGDGNADFMTYSDGVHPSFAGHGFLARHAAAGIAVQLPA